MPNPYGAQRELLAMNRQTNEISRHQSVPRGTVGVSTSASTGQGQSVQYVSAQAQHNFQRSDIRHYSFASSMDLISSTHASATAHVNEYQSPQSQPLHSGLFLSSSHHTSHTAAAGDLLTMSRRALEPLQLNSFTKKRSFTTTAEAAATDNAGELNFIRSYSVPTQGLYNPLNPTQQLIQQHIHPSEHGNPIEKKELLIPNQSPSTSHQEHRTIRRCLRSDSFEMMEDD
ncbi:hypothetical protein ACHAXA_001745 [Cyclostephanos tholiformis]|uniref:Uncharacterized protein n=1 Tax=Cyclostephanos tholiformis TaxID=382380 RepID=A0ABD3SCW6_9STRA